MKPTRRNSRHSRNGLRGRTSSRQASHSFAGGSRSLASDIELVLSALQASALHPFHLLQWGGGGILAEVEAQAVAPLFAELIDHSVEGYAVALDLMGMYAFRRSEVLENFRPHLRWAAENLMRWSTSRLPWDGRAPLR